MGASCAAARHTSRQCARTVPCRASVQCEGRAAPMAHDGKCRSHRATVRFAPDARRAIERWMKVGLLAAVPAPRIPATGRPRMTVVLFSNMPPFPVGSGRPHTLYTMDMRPPPRHSNARARSGLAPARRFAATSRAHATPGLRGPPRRPRRQGRNRPRDARPRGRLHPAAMPRDRSAAPVARRSPRRHAESERAPFRAIRSRTRGEETMNRNEPLRDALNAWRGAGAGRLLAASRPAMLAAGRSWGQS